MPERAHLERQTLLQVARGDARRIELLDAGQRRGHHRLGHPGLAGDLLEARLQVAALVDVADDEVGRHLLVGGEARELQLPVQVLGERGPPRQRRFEGGPLAVVPRLARRRRRVVLGVALPVDVGELLGVGRLALGAGRRLGRRGLGRRRARSRRELRGGLGLGLGARGQRGLLVALQGLLEDRILLELLLDQPHELQPREL